MTDTREWADFATAQGAVENGMHGGIGFVLGDGIVGVDLDKCRNSETGALTAKAQNIVDRLSSYTEVSPSGRGVHILVLADTDMNRKQDGVEIYSRNRYFTFTGEHVPGTPDDLLERTEELAGLCKDLFASTAVSFSGAGPRAMLRTDTNAQSRSWAGLRNNWRPNDEDDDLLLARAQGAPGSGAKFADLFTGCWEHRYKSQSEADLALCALLAYWTEGDQNRIDRLFRRSGLMRPKWEERHGDTTYGGMTVSRALK